jgi:hypothetical protein
MSTYTPIATQTLGSAAASVTFSSIPQGYTDLVLIANRSSSGLDNLSMQFNGDTGSNYSFTVLYGTGSTAGSYRGSNTNNPYLDFYASSSSSLPTPVIMNIQNYSNSTTYKTTLARGNAAATGVDATVMLWRNTSAITSILLKCHDGSNFTTGSTFSIYGIQVGDKAQKAQGGNIVTSDGTYVYHAFTSSGSFIPNQSLTADYLIVAGGGGGGGQMGGGGGAGGLRAFAASSLTAQNYTVTVGAGGAGGNGGTNAAATNGGTTSFNSTSVSGGGGGAGNANASPARHGLNGGSGGGGGINNATAGTGNAGSYSPVEGYAGGAGSSSNGGAGGGGAGAVGTAKDGANIGRPGGIGANTYNSINFSSWLSATGTGSGGYLAGGGGGGAYDGDGVGAGGTGGGGTGNNANSGSNPTTVQAAVANTGGGGGGGSQYGGAGIGGTGGSGIVIVRYLA